MSIILFIHQSAEMYGSDKVLLLLAQGVRDSGKYKPVVLLPEKGPLYEALKFEGIEVHLGEVVKISRSVFTVIGIIQLIRRMHSGVKGLDRIVANRTIAAVHSNTLAVLVGACWALLRRVRHLWHVHEIILSPAFVSKAFPYLISMLSCRVISNSKSTEQWLLEVKPNLESRSHVIFNGLPPVLTPILSSVERFRKEINANDNTIVISLVGRINLWKGQELLIEAASLLVHEKCFARVHFVIVGGAAPGMEDLPLHLQSKVNKLGLNGHFSFLPFTEDIWSVWFGSDIAVVPSIEPEPFGMVAIEAMGAGVPVIAAAHGGLMDIIIHNESGFLVPPRNAQALSDAISLLAGNRALRQSLGDMGKLRQKEMFSIDTQISKTLKIYDDINIPRVVSVCHRH